MSHEVLKEVRPRNSFGWVTEPPASVSHQSFGLIPDPNDEALLTTQMSRLGVSQSVVDFSPRSHLSQVHYISYPSFVVVIAFFFFFFV